MRWMNGLNLEDVLALPPEYRSDILDMMKEEQEFYENLRS